MFYAPAQDKCRNRHPADARGAGKRVAAQCSSSKEDRGAAWRAHNATMQAQQPASACEQPALPQACNGQSDSRLNSPHTSQPAAHQLESSRSSSQASPAQASCAAEGARPSQLPHAHQGSLRHLATDIRNSGENQAQTLAGRPDMQDSLRGHDSIASTPARKKQSYARLGPAGLSPEQAAASSAGGADLDSTGSRRFKIRNRFRAGVFRRCNGSSFAIPQKDCLDLIPTFPCQVFLQILTEKVLSLLQ